MWIVRSIWGPVGRGGQFVDPSDGRWGTRIPRATRRSCSELLGAVVQSCGTTQGGRREPYGSHVGPGKGSIAD